MPQQDAHLGVLREGLAIDALDVPGLYFGTSTGQVFASADEGESWSEIASYLRDRVGRRRGDRMAVAELHLSTTLLPLFHDLPRRSRSTRQAWTRRSRASTSAGLRDRLCEMGPTLRPHSNVSVIAAISGG